MQRSFPALVALAFFGLLGLDAHARPTPTRSRPKVQLSKVQRPLTRKQLAPMRNKAASAVIADLLVRFAEGKGRTKLEKRVAKRLSKSRKKVAAARRLATRWTATTATARRRLLGRTEIGSKPSKSTLQAAVGDATPQPFWALRPTIPMPPEWDEPKPSSYELKVSGIQTITTRDADGSDELSTLVVVATPVWNTYELATVSVPPDGTVAAPAATTTKIDTTIYNGVENDMLVITALIEDEGGNAAAARAEVEVLIDLAASVAETLSGSDRMAVLQAMLDYTFAMQNLGADPQTATRSIASVKLAKQDWFALWGVDPTALDGVPYKLAVPHTIASGKYELLLNAPSVLPGMVTVRVAIDRFWVEDLQPTQDSKHPEWIRLTTWIKDAKDSIKLPPQVFDKKWIAIYERKVNAGDVQLGFEGTLLLAAKSSDPATEKKIAYCMERWWDYSCNWAAIAPWVHLGPENESLHRVTYSTETHRFKKVRSPRGTAPNKLTTKGTSARRGGLTITVTDVAP
jgi:hypothetical protein